MPIWPDKGSDAAGDQDRDLGILHRREVRGADKVLKVCNKVAIEVSEANKSLEFLNGSGGGPVTDCFHFLFVFSIFHCLFVYPWHQLCSPGTE